MDRQAIDDALQATNQHRCTPPLDTPEVECIASSCASYDVGEDVFPTMYRTRFLGHTFALRGMA